MNNALKIKVCGMRDAENIRSVESLGIDLMGFIFWPRSSRYVNERPAYLPTKCKRVGVFVDEERERVVQTAGDYALDVIQLHGHETPDYCARLRQGWEGASPTTCKTTCPALIKAFNIATADDLAKTIPYTGLVDCFLFDTKGKSVGGNGEKFDWSLLEGYDGSTPFLLSGGISPDDAPLIRSLFLEGSGPVAAHCIGIDLNSCFEVEPALKDIQKLKSFLEQL